MTFAGLIFYQSNAPVEIPENQYGSCKYSDIETRFYANFQTRMSCIIGCTYLLFGLLLEKMYIVSLTSVAKCRAIQYNMHFYFWNSCNVDNLRQAQHVSRKNKFLQRAHDIHCKIKGIDYNKCD